MKKISSHEMLTYIADLQSKENLAKNKIVFDKAKAISKFVSLASTDGYSCSKVFRLLMCSYIGESLDRNERFWIYRPTDYLYIYVLNENLLTGDFLAGSSDEIYSKEKVNWLSDMYIWMGHFLQMPLKTTYQTFSESELLINFAPLHPGVKAQVNAELLSKKFIGS